MRIIIMSCIFTVRNKTNIQIHFKTKGVETNAFHGEIAVIKRFHNVTSGNHSNSSANVGRYTNHIMSGSTFCFPFYSRKLFPFSRKDNMKSMHFIGYVPSQLLSQLMYVLIQRNDGKYCRHAMKGNILLASTAKKKKPKHTYIPPIQSILCTRHQSIVTKVPSSIRAGDFILRLTPVWSMW
jgi:hypothetical protein